MKKLEEAIDRLKKKNKERGSSSFKLVKMEDVKNSSSNAPAASKFTHPVDELDLSKVTILNKRNYIKPDWEKEKPSALKMNSVTIEEESGTDKKEDINLVAIQKYFADLDPTSSNMKTSILESCGSHPRRGPLLSFKTPSSQPNASHHKVAEDIWTQDGSLPSDKSRTEGVVIQGSEELVLEEHVAPQESSSKRMREEVGARVDEKERVQVKQTVGELLQSPAIDQVSLVLGLDPWPDSNNAFLAAPGDFTRSKQFIIGFIGVPW